MTTPARDRDRTVSSRRSEEHTSELQSQSNLVCRLLLGKKTLLACLDFKADMLATGERVEVHARVKTGSVEEILFSVLSRDESKPAVLDQLLDRPCRHRKSPLLES